MTDELKEVTVKDLMHEFRYEDEDENLVTQKLAGAKAILKNAGAYDETSALLNPVLSVMVGFMMENRDGMNEGMNDITWFPLSLQGMINSLRYNKTEKESDGDG